MFIKPVVSQYSPSDQFVENAREFNIVIGAIACLVLLFCLARPRWKTWNVPTRLGWMSLFMLCLTGTYGTFELRYLDTNFRVLMVTVSLLWAIIAALWPREDTRYWFRKR